MQTSTEQSIQSSSSVPKEHQPEKQFVLAKNNQDEME